MGVIRSEKQKDNVAKFFWDMAKVALALFGLGPIAKPEGTSLLLLAMGIAMGIVFAGVAYALDGKEIEA